MVLLSILSAVVFCLGTLDGSSAEFALSPAGFDRYVSEGFADPERYFFLEDQTAAEFPFVLAGPSADFAGANYWAGPTLVRQKFVLSLAHVHRRLPYEVEVWLTDVGYEDGMHLTLTVNGTDLDLPVERDTRRLLYTIPGGVLHDGTNLLQLRIFHGKYVCFDCLTLKGDRRTRVRKTGDRAVVDITLADYSLTRASGAGAFQPLLVSALSRRDRTLDIEINGKVTSYDIAAGESRLEIGTGEVPAGAALKVAVRDGGSLRASGTFFPDAAPLRGSIDYVDQFMGSSGSRWMIGPGPWMPFGMVKLMPDNEDAHWKCGYEYNIDNIMGFSHVHEWTMAGLLTMPTNGPLKLQPGSEKDPDAGYRSRIDKRTEIAEIGRYGVDLLDYGIKAEVTASTRCSFQKYTFHRSDSARVLVDLFFPAEYWWQVRSARIEKVSDHCIAGSVVSESRYTGYRGVQEYTLHFYMESDRPFRALNAWQDGASYPEIASEVELGGDCGVWLDYDLDDGEAVQLRTGISLVSKKNAALNLRTEISEPCGWSFDAVADAQRAAWQRLFDRIRVETPDQRLKTKFYTNLYRAISPRTIWNDVNGEWVDMNGAVALAEPGRDVYGGDSLWGTQWDLVPFYAILYPEFLSNWLYTFEQCFKRGGWLPVGNPGMKYFRVMVGSPAVSCISSAFQHGVRDFDIPLLADAVTHQQTAPPVLWPDGTQLGNESYPDYIDLGYVPLYDDAHVYESPHYQSYVSNTMEYAYQDWCAAQFLRAVGRETEAGLIGKRSSNWKNVFDKDLGFVRPRYPDGRFLESFDPFRAPGFCEGSSWQYTWYVPQDVPGLIEAMGERRFIDKLDWAMSESSKVNFNALGDDFARYPINQGNQTTMHAAYLFSFTSEPWKAQRWAREVQCKYYGCGERDAYPGDEDQGQMSSWYVLSSLGFFEMDGGCSDDPLLCIGSPAFERVHIHLSDRYYGGSDLVLEAPGTTRSRCYVTGVDVNGVKSSPYFLRWSEIRRGGLVRFTMSDNHL